MVRLYIRNVLVGIDQLLNAILLGSPDECISTRAYDHFPLLRKVIDFVFGKGHCERSKESEEDKGVID
jgi:hypothetical protein